jgi:hypothetical protein
MAMKAHCRDYTIFGTLSTSAITLTLNLILINATTSITTSTMHPSALSDYRPSPHKPTLNLVKERPRPRDQV